MPSILTKRKLTLVKFIQQYVEPNTLIRLWFKTDEGHERAYDKPIMEWEILKGMINVYHKRRVIGVTDILVHDNFKEAVNIVIERN